MVLCAGFLSHLLQDAGLQFPINMYPRGALRVWSEEIFAMARSLYPLHPITGQHWAADLCDASKPLQRSWAVYPTDVKSLSCGIYLADSAEDSMAVAFQYAVGRRVCVERHAAWLMPGLGGYLGACRSGGMAHVVTNLGT